VKAPIVIGRDHLDAGSVASPNRETEAMRDGSDAIADWPLLNALVNTAAGATWVSLHHGGGVGIGYSIHAGMVVVADGTDAAAIRLQRSSPRSGDGRPPARRRGLPAGDRLRGADGPRRPDAALTFAPRPRRIALAVVAAAGALGALAARLAPVTDGALREREDRFVAAAAARLEADVRTLVRAAERLQASTDFSSIVDAGGVEIRPARLFSVLASALPKGGDGASSFSTPPGARSPGRATPPSCRRSRRRRVAALPFRSTSRASRLRGARREWSPASGADSSSSPGVTRRESSGRT